MVGPQVAAQPSSRPPASRSGVQGVGGTGCTGTPTTYLDYVKVQVDYEAPSPPIKGPNSEDLEDQGAWAAVNSQGEDVVDGDAYSV